jgi:hypothetical protein
MLMFSVKDVVSGQFSRIELFNNNEVALRWYNGLLAESKIAKELQLYCLGTYNLETGDVLPQLEFVQGGTVSE